MGGDGCKSWGVNFLGKFCDFFYHESHEFSRMGFGVDIACEGGVGMVFE